MTSAFATLGVICCFAIAVQGNSSNDVDPLVKIKNGTLVGVLMKTRKGREYAGFRGIPYALPPIGELRFQPPRPTASWDGVRSAKEDAEICVQRNIYVHQEEIVGNEDCLYLNVYTPKLPTSGPGNLDNPHPALPVLVWFHGGGWIAGAGHSEFYNAKFLLDHDVILVTMNFRLGPLGFLSTEDMASPGNYGLKDQNQAMRWIQENIAAFGGDRNRVTIFGESAGGASVNFHMMSPLSKGLFHRGISESGTAICPWVLTRPGLAIRQTRRLGQLMDCDQDDTAKLIECLRTKDAVDITATDRDFQEFGYCPMIPFRPVVEPLHPGAFLIEDPATALKFGRQVDVPWMTGITSHEGSLKVPEIYGINNGEQAKLLDKDFEKWAPTTLMYQHHCPKEHHSEVAKRIREFYLGDLPIDNSTRYNIIDMYSDAWFNVAADNAVRDYLDTMASPIFYYYFAYRGDVSFSSIFGDPDHDYGVSHADELQYLFPVGEQLFKDVTLSEESLKIVDIITSLWANFAKSGNPTPEVTPTLPVKWLPVRTHNLEYLHIGGSQELYMAYNLLPERMQFWATLPLQGLSYVDANDARPSKDEL
ncbi:venom carboxylesterase-6-like [Diprion similis]|uniref:venom carboxylesterase-6-like n=1 Tax=Diprion similis TaxID=362088 RepID=UPI001EF992A0|nr:venom carboxylesterase-6-like [Diprion similis]